MALRPYVSKIQEKLIYRKPAVLGSFGHIHPTTSNRIWPKQPKGTSSRQDILFELISIRNKDTAWPIIDDGQMDRRLDGETPQIYRPRPLGLESKNIAQCGDPEKNEHGDATSIEYQNEPVPIYSFNYL